MTMMIKSTIFNRSYLKVYYLIKLYTSSLSGVTRLCHIKVTHSSSPIKGDHFPDNYLLSILFLSTPLSPLVFYTHAPIPPIDSSRCFNTLSTWCQAQCTTCPFNLIHLSFFSRLSHVLTLGPVYE